MPKIGLATMAREAKEETETGEYKEVPVTVVEDKDAKSESAGVPPKEEKPKRTRSGGTARKKVSTSKEIAKPAAGAATGIEGDFGSEDLQMPYLSLLQPTSPKVEDLGSDRIGHFIFDGAFDLGESLTVVVFGLRKLYKEVLDDEDEDFPRTFYSREEAIESGAEFKPAAAIHLAIEIESDSEDAEVSTFELGDKAYILARYEVSGRSYNAAKSIYTSVNRNKDANLWDRYYSITAKVKPVRNQKFRVPIVTAGVETDEDLRSAIESGAV